MANPARRRLSPANEMQTVRAGRKPNARLRTREYLTETEVELLIKAASRNRHGQRDATLTFRSR
jgi:type 1 fimbriae regulatory protein FimB/type 1 fimbriae regulatory protein FimE